MVSDPACNGIIEPAKNTQLFIPAILKRIKEFLLPEGDLQDEKSCFVKIYLNIKLYP